MKFWLQSLRGLAWAVGLLVLCALLGIGLARANEAPSASIELEPPPIRTESVRAAQEYNRPWEYRWGDSPQDRQGVLAWAVLPIQQGWQPLPSLQTPPDRNGQRFLWMRTKLDGPIVSDPTLLLEIVDQIFEAYLDGQLIYRFGQLDGQDEKARRFLGYRIHFLPLSESPNSTGDYRGKTLTLRIYSAHINIGVFGRVWIGTRARLLTAAMQQDSGKIVVGVVLCAVGLFVLMLFLYERSDRAYLFYALFAFGTGLWILCQIKLRGELSPSPLTFTYVELYSFYLAVTGLMLFLERTMGRGPARFTWLLSRVMVAYDLVSAVLIATGTVTLLQTLLPFQLLLLLSVVYTLALIAVSIFSGDADARLFGLGFSAAATFVAYDVLAALGFLPRVNLASSHLGQGAFVLTLGLILVRRFRLVHLDLVHAKTALSEQVEALESRNAEIERLVSELRHQIEARSKALVESLIDSGQSGQDAQPVLSLGSIINKRYRVLHVLGQGAMGVVYAVERLSDKRHFAAKILASRAGRESLARFVREAQLLAHLDHPNLVTITDVDITEERVAYIVMELVNGTTLSQQQQRFRELDFVLPVLRQVADALSKVHAEGIVHRDLKPANILVAMGQEGTEPVVKLVDFGVSALTSTEEQPQKESRKAVVPEKEPQPAVVLEPPRAIAASAFLETIDDSRSSRSDGAEYAAAATSSLPELSGSPSANYGHALTQTGVVMGTPLYMAPELAHGAKLAKPSSDVFCFGVIAYELLAGRRPSENPPMLIRFKPGRRWFKPLLDRNPQVPAPIAEIVERCLEVHPALRPTAAQVLETFIKNAAR